MGMVVNGAWQRGDAGATMTGGRFQRADTSFRHWITPDGESGFPAAPGRYRLYVSLACPWAHRTLIMRALKGLEAMIAVSVTHWLMDEDGWNFAPGEKVVPDPRGAERVHQIYVSAAPRYTGRASVPVLWDDERRTIVSNESADIIRMLGQAFDRIGARAGDYYPAALRPEIDQLNERIYATLNNGVYRAGFATTQAAYEEAVRPLFETLDWLEARLQRQSLLCGEVLTEADIRLFTTLIRFDPVYVGHFKCNLRRLVDYPALWDYARAIYQLPDVRPTVDFGHIKRHYHMSHPTVNPRRIVPLGPLLDFDAPATREVTLPSH